MHLHQLVAFVFVSLVWASAGIKSGKAADFYVETLPDYSGDDFPVMHAGQLDVGQGMGLGERSLFFWHIQAEINSRTTFVWLNGGPGCSSMDGALLEVGPFRFNKETKQLYRSKDSWSSFTNLLFIDQPFGTGFSDPTETEESGQFIQSLEQAGGMVAEFLYQYAEVFPEIRNTRVYLAGESFAGQYIPHIWKSLTNRPEVGLRLDPKNVTSGVHGMVLISPWIDPPHQYLSQPVYAKQNSLVDQEFFETLDALNEACMEGLQDSHSFEQDACERMNTFMLQVSKGGLNSKQCFNIYDISKTSPYPDCGSEWPEELPLVEKYLSREDVQQALHVNEKHPWQECSNKVHKAMQKGTVASEFTGKILEEIPMMIVVGDNDFICNYLGLEHFIKNLEWNGGLGFASGQLETLDYGTYQSERNLTFAKVTNGSHMLPVDHLEVTGDLIKRFIGISDLPSSTVSAPVSSSTSSVEATSKPSADDEAINRAMYRAYKQAGVVALIVVIIVFLFLGIVWWRRGQGLSGGDLLNALMQIGRRPYRRANEDSVPLRNMGRRPSAILEEEEEEDEYYV